MKYPLLLTLYISSAPLFPAELTINNNYDSHQLANGKKCFFSNLSPCKEDLMALSYQEVLEIAEHVISYANSKYQFSTIDDQYNHYLSTIHAASFYAKFSFSTCYYEFGYQPLYHLLQTEWQTRATKWIEVGISGAWELFFMKNYPKINMWFSGSKYHDEFFKKLFSNQESTDYAHKQAEEADAQKLPKKNKIKFITDNCDKNRLITLLCYNLIDNWVKVHDEFMDKIPSWDISIRRIVDIPPEARENEFLRPFIKEIINQERKFIEKAINNPTI